MLRIENLSKRFGKNTASEVLAIDGLSLRVSPGEFACVIGSNGAGKSTLLACVSGATRPDEGKIVLEGEDITRQPENKRAGKIGRVFQDPLSGTCASMTIEENMALANRRGKPRTLRMGITKKEREKFREALSELNLGLENRLRDPVGLLSGGQRQSLSLIMATLVRPTLLLLDEHTAALDPKTANLVMNLTAEVVEKEKLTTVMITHNMRLALLHGTRLLMMHRGQILLDFDELSKSKLTLQDLLEKFDVALPENNTAGVLSDRMLLG
ncbi:MAG: ATP-binding cassette domain-containing protein [Deltaproteobacteria bacterium]|nr:ATP-binding cassette domain-containing protein [Deltaproteobacteria bacterium]